MTPAQIIALKRDGGELSDRQIATFIQGYARGDIPDYQMSAMAMAVFIRGMTTAETAALTEQMLHSGVVLQWPAGSRPIVDKHSTGGIGDKVSLILAPLLACCGLRVPMLSGRGLGATGGTLDKLDAVPGFRTDLTIEEMQSVTQKVGCVITGASDKLVPADKKLYALRDVTGTVPSIPLITASIMSKKLAEGLDSLVLDVKFGSGAFMKTPEDAHELALSLVQVGLRMGVNTTALLTDMNQPLGRMAGNLVEVTESIAVLQNEGPKDVEELVCALGNELLLHEGIVGSADEGTSLQKHILASGQALDKFREMVAAQGGDLDAMPSAAPANDVVATRDGYLQAVDAEAIGQAIILLGGGRKVVGDKIDHRVGVEMLVRIGERIERSQPILRVFANHGTFENARPSLQQVMTLGAESASALPLILERVTVKS